MNLSDAAGAMEELSVNQREALILVGARGFSYEEAAGICGTPLGTLKSRVKRGHDALLTILDSGEALSRRASGRAVNVSEDTQERLGALRAGVPKMIGAPEHSQCAASQS